MKHMYDDCVTPQAHLTAKKSILLVDDCVDHLELNRLVLQMDGFQVTTAEGGPQALKILNGLGKPDLILLDLRMDEMTGLEFLLELEKQQPQILEAVPVVFLTAAEKVPASKATGLIRRPIDVINFLQVIREFIQTGIERSQPHLSTIE